MKYSFRILRLKSGRKRLVIDIDGEENIALSSMINTEMPNFGDDILEAVETALKGEETGFGGNLYSIICNKDFTVVENQMVEEEVSRVPTIVLKELLDQWNEKTKNELEVTKMIKDDCIFCKLANGVFPTNTVYEDDDFRVILDAAPAAKGHSLIIPKQHADNLYEADDEMASKLMPLAKRVANAMKKSFACDGVNVLQNNEPAAGQTVFHLHVHVIPRYLNDNIGLIWKPQEVDSEEQARIAELLGSNM